MTNLAGAYKITESVTAFARADNLLDTRFETADGFKAPGQQVRLGVQAGF